MPRPFTGPADAPAPKLRQGLAKLSLALRHEQWTAGTAQGMTPTQTQILTTLAAHEAPLRPGTLARELAVTAPTITDAVRALERKNLVRRTPDPHDRRAARLALTARGRRTARRQAQWPDLLLQTLDTLAPEEQGVLLRALIKIIARLQEERRISTARMCATCTFFRPYAHPDARRPHHCAYVDAPFGDRELRLDCPDHAPADPAARRALWSRFTRATLERSQP
ncbi:MAG TPA: helix-turn-helix domain-containing protein [Gemmatimonadales bacterium]|nr:helix-turn-helix domain-containing protein [Gemmatimonadales bacterium]